MVTGLYGEGGIIMQTITLAYNSKSGKYSVTPHNIPWANQEFVYDLDAEVWKYHEKDIRFKGAELKQDCCTKPTWDFLERYSKIILKGL